MLSPDGRVSRAVLPPPKRHRDSYRIAQARFPTNLAGTRLLSKGTPYAQQDGRISACATAATWMSTFILSHKFSHSTRTYNMVEITELATQYTAAPRGSITPPPLNSEQIVHALTINLVKAIKII